MFLRVVDLRSFWQEMVFIKYFFQELTEFISMVEKNHGKI